jgi:hypothetical protein
MKFTKMGLNLITNAQDEPIDSRLDVGSSNIYLNNIIKSLFKAYELSGNVVISDKLRARVYRFIPNININVLFDKVSVMPLKDKEHKGKDFLLLKNIIIRLCYWNEEYVNDYTPFNDVPPDIRRQIENLKHRARLNINNLGVDLQPKFTYNRKLCENLFLQKSGENLSEYELSNYIEYLS